ncbi:MAG: hypothetical protein ACI9CQ_004582, partial [Saprospiraceae bacterium]
MELGVQQDYQYRYWLGQSSLFKPFFESIFHLFV